MASTVMVVRVLVKAVRRILGAGSRSRYETDRIFFDTGAKLLDEDDEEHCDCLQGESESAPASLHSLLSTHGSLQLTHRDGRAKDEDSADAEAEAEQYLTTHLFPSHSIVEVALGVEVVTVVSCWIISAECECGGRGR